MKVRFPIKRKVLLLTLALSLALVVAAVFISYRFFSRQIRKNTEEMCLEVTAGVAAELQEEYSSFLRNYREKAAPIYEGYLTEIEHYSTDFPPADPERRDFFENLTQGLFPPKGSLGMSYETALFVNEYHAVIGNLSLVGTSAGMQSGFVYYVDETNGNLVYLLDSVAEDSPFYRFPLSIEKMNDSQWAAFLGDGKTGSFLGEDYCFCLYPIYDQEAPETVLAYVSYSYSMTDNLIIQENFMLTNGLVMLGVTLLLALVYFLFVERFVAKPIVQLSESAQTFVDQMEKNEPLRAVPGAVHTRDELGDLSDRMDLMQQKIVEYVDTLAQKTAREESMRVELTIASRIQTEALPESGFRAGRFQVDSFIRPAKEVGGDLYDYFMVDEDHLFFVIADVSGKGIPAALFMMRGKELIRAQAMLGQPPGQIARAANEELCRGNDEGLFITAFFGIVTLSESLLTYACAGHEKPFLLRNGRAAQISEESNIVLGLFEGMDFEEGMLPLEDGDRLLVFTDGLDEGIDPDNEAFGYERIRRTLEQGKEDVLQELFDELTAFTRGREQFDDVTMLLLKVEKEAFERTVSGPDYSAIFLLTEDLKEQLPGAGEELTAQLAIVIDEVVNNIVSYGLAQAKDPYLRFALEKSEESVRLTFADNGIPFDPLAGSDFLSELESEDELWDRQEGGAGLVLVKQLSDACEYEFRDGENRLSVTKHL